MKLNSFSLFGVALVFAAGAAGLHFKSVKPIAISGSTPAAVAMPMQSGANLNLKTMQIRALVERLPGGGIVNLPANVPPSNYFSAVGTRELTGTETLK